MRRSRVALVSCSVLLASVLPTIASAHEPIQGASRQYSSSDPVLEWHFYNPNYSSWLADPIRHSLDEGVADGDAWWDNSDLNNSDVQNFLMTTGGSDTIKYTASSTSPCSGSSIWLMCADNDINNDGNKSDWFIYVRSLSGAPLSGYKWHDEGYATASYTTFDVARNVLHEGIHITMGVGNHDPQLAIHTLMTAASPDAADDDWAVKHVQECDQARMQMIFGLLSSSGGIAQCFDDPSLAMESNGLATVASLTSPTSGCLGGYMPFSGRIRTGTHSEYGQMSTIGLGGRTMTVKRNGTTSMTAITDSGGYFSGYVYASAGGTFSFTASFAGLGPNALSPDTSAADSVTVLPPC